MMKAEPREEIENDHDRLGVMPPSLAVARAFLQDFEINDEFLRVLDNQVYNMAYDADAYDRICEEGREDDEEYRIKITDAIAADMSETTPECRVAFLFERGIEKDQLKAEILRETTPCPARAFLQDFEINDEFLRVLDNQVYNMAYDADAYDRICEEGREDDEEYRIKITDAIAADMSETTPECRVAFLFERGIEEDQLKAEILRETTPCP